MPSQLKPLPRSAISRITAILSTFLTGVSHSVTEIARLTGLPLSTTHRLAADLASWQLLHRTADGQYEVGIILRQLGGDGWSVPMLVERGPHVVTDLDWVQSFLVGILSWGIAQAVMANTYLPPELTEEVSLENVNFVSNDQLRELLAGTNATESQTATDNLPRVGAFHRCTGFDK